MILAPRRHDRQLWADLLRNCGIDHPLSLDDITQATSIVSLGQADIVFVDESYGPQDIAKILIPARQVEFAGGRGVCLILCSKKATAQDVLNARKLGFASLVILPASIDTVRKHLELAARYIPQTDEELGWSKPKVKAPAKKPTEHAAREDASSDGFHARQASQPRHASGNNEAMANGDRGKADAANGDDEAVPLARQSSFEVDQSPLREEDAQLVRGPHISEQAHAAQGSSPALASSLAEEKQAQADSKIPQLRPKQNPISDLDEDLPKLTAPGRSGRSADEEVVFL